MLRKVKVENGIVQGLPAADPRITAFRGIPFAAPPVGGLRWKAPQPAHDWDGVLCAYQFAPISMQEKLGLDQTSIYTREWNVDPEIPMSEDCLYLNVWTPATDPDQRLPVFVWYFGGALQVGNPAEMEFNGERIARRGIVVVTVNYRLNVFGFLAHPELTEENPDFPANFGHLDQKFATEWVKRNIAAFGGDPGNITIGGQSAGGGSVLVQLTSPLTAGLFRKAIVQSGSMLGAYAGGGPGTAQDLSAAEKAGEDFFRHLGVKTLAEAKALDSAFLRDKSLTFGGSWEDRVAAWRTAVDGRFIPGDPMKLMLQTRRHMVPLLMGHTSSEFLSAPEVSAWEDLEALAERKFGTRAGEFLTLCRGSDIGEATARAKFSPIELAIRAIYQKTAATENAPANYYYVFDGDIPGWDNPGTFHSVDLWFFFETLGVCWRPFIGRHYDLARQMCNYWANFIRSADPNGPDADGMPMPEWMSYDVSKSSMYFTDKPMMSITDNQSSLIRFLVDYYLHSNGQQEVSAK